MKLFLAAITLTTTLTTFAAEQATQNLTMQSKSLRCNISLEYEPVEGKLVEKDVPQGLVIAKELQLEAKNKLIALALSKISSLSTEESLACATIRKRHLDARMNFGFMYGKLTVKKSDPKHIIDGQCATELQVALDVLPVESLDATVGNIVLTTKQTLVAPCK